MIETLKPRLRDAEKQERQMKAGNMIGSMFSAVLWGTLLGSPAAGVAVASVSGTEREGKIREETGVHQLRELLTTATMARTRLARASGYGDPGTRIPMKFVVICLTVVAVLMLAIAIAVATSS
jgi:cytochrome bd-type quinol oxidase subunit 2